MKSGRVLAVGSFICVKARLASQDVLERDQLGGVQPPHPETEIALQFKYESRMSH